MQLDLLSYQTTVLLPNKPMTVGLRAAMTRKADKERRAKQVILKKEAGVTTFGSMAEAWMDREAVRWTPRHEQIIRDAFRRDVFPDLAQRPIADITSKELFSVLRKVEERGAYDVVKRLNQRCAQVFLHAMLTGECESNPAGSLTRAFKSPRVVHRPAISQRELPKLWQRLSNYPGSDVVRLAFQFLILTFVRPGELRGARWTELDLANATWIIPAARMKMRREHIVPLSLQALALLYELKALTGEGELLFPSPWNTGKPISDVTLLKAIHRMGFKGKCVPHGFRATAATILSENNFLVDVIERQLAHLEQNEVKAAYHRGEFLIQRREMMDWWGRYVASCGVS